MAQKNTNKMLLTEKTKNDKIKFRPANGSLKTTTEKKSEKHQKALDKRAGRW